MISFIVPAYNEESLLSQTLAAIFKAGEATQEPFEVLVVDDASTDRTAQIALEQGARVVPVSHRQIAATRNSGAKAATGEMLIFVDADTTITPEAVIGAIQAMRQGAIGGGCKFHLDGHVPLYARFLLSIAMPIYEWCRLASGCFLFCTRSAFDAAGGFDEKLFAAEEASMSRRLGRQGRFMILKEYVTTSGRKLRSHSAREILGLMARVVVSGSRSIQKRQGLEIWYGERRTDPGGDPCTRPD